jgi:hypothetical protein
MKILLCIHACARFEVVFQKPAIFHGLLPRVRLVEN